MVFISPKNAVVDFLRKYLIDPRARAETEEEQLFDGGSTDFQITPSTGKFSAVIEVKVGGQIQKKWKDYYVDILNFKVIFFTNTPSGTDNVSIKFKRGDENKNWIYPDKARTDLNKESFPRINILIIGGPGGRVGQYKSDVESVTHFQVDIWAKEGYVAEIGDNKYEGDKLTEYIGYQILKAFNENINELHPLLYNYNLLSQPRDMGFDAEIQCFHSIVEFELKGLNSGEVQ
jgi:hypothetical protein